MANLAQAVSRQIKVPFHGAELYVVERGNQPYTPMKPIVEGMGLDWGGQHKKLAANQDRWGISVMEIPSAGGLQDALCLPLRKLGGWLMTVHASRVRPEIRDRIVQYQNECDDVLWRYWSEGIAENPRRPDEATAADLLANARFHISFDGEGRPESLKRVPDDSFVVNPLNFADILGEPGIISPRLLPEIIQACAKRLADIEKHKRGVH